MPGHKKPRCCRAVGDETIFKPAGVPFCGLSEQVLELDELEAMRLCDLEGLSQAEAGVRMGVSRGTVQRLLARGRSTVLTALLSKHALRLRGTLPDPREPAGTAPDRSEPNTPRGNGS